MNRYTLFSIFILGATMVTPVIARAAIISVQSDNAIAAGDTAIIDVYLDTEGEKVNVVDGSITFGDVVPVRFVDLSVGGSPFTLWPRKPSLEANGKTISFVGGSPTSVQGSRVKIFSASVTPLAQGVLSVRQVSVTVFRADGLGSSIAATVGNNSIAIGAKRSHPKDYLGERLARDTEAPEKFSVEVSRDPSIAGGQRFLSFSSIDRESGIDYYTVIEKGYPEVRTGETYVLLNQDGKIHATITAHDRAGNVRTVVYRDRSTLRIVLAGVIAIAVILGLIGIFRRLAR